LHRGREQHQDNRDQEPLHGSPPLEDGRTSPRETAPRGIDR
jgi:hypothetical protein